MGNVSIRPEYRGSGTKLTGLMLERRDKELVRVCLLDLAADSPIEPILAACPQSSSLLWNLCHSGIHRDSSQGSQQLERGIHGVRGQVDRLKAGFSYRINTVTVDRSYRLACPTPNTRSAGDIDVCSQRWAAISKTPVTFAALFRVFQGLFLAGTIFLLAGMNSECWPFSFHET